MTKWLRPQEHEPVRDVPSSIPDTMYEGKLQCSARKDVELMSPSIKRKQFRFSALPALQICSFT